jgi:hypothetical protein
MLLNSFIMPIFRKIVDFATPKIEIKEYKDKEYKDNGSRDMGPVK